MKRLLIFVMLAVCASPKAFAQGVGTSAGRVVDEFDGMGLPGANVIVEGTSLGAATNLDGEYEIHDAPVGVYNVTARFIGYDDVTEMNVEVNPGFTRTLNFELGDDTIVFDYEPSCYFYWRPLLWHYAYARKVVWRADYCSISLENLPVER